MTAATKQGGTLTEPVDKLKDEARQYAQALGERALKSVGDRIAGSTGKLLDYAEGNGGPGLKAAAEGAKRLAEGQSPARSVLGAAGKAVTGLFGRSGGGGGGGGKKLKVTNIEEDIEVGVPVRLAYDQWTRFTDFPSFMKKVESVEQESDEKLKWQAQILWSHRGWESTIKQQVPDERIVWTSKGQRGHVDGAVSFHEIAPNLTKVLLVLEYHPQGGFEYIGNLWRAQGRRARLELKHYRRQMMTQAVLHPDEIEGWRGVIEDGEVVKDHQSAIEEEQDTEQDTGARDSYEDEADAEDEDYPEEDDQR
ncbi:MAG TPA: SRPBCC family protein [Streptosporangiaceae bacterium]|nr:SRPBCC family protein [Streptosporangiaceae bacterium]